MRQAVCAALLVLYSSTLSGQQPGTGHAAELRGIDPSAVQWTECDPQNLPGCEFVQLSGDPSTGPSVFLLRTPPDAEARLMYHRRTNESLVVVSGTLLVLGEEGRETELRAGSYLFIPARSIHGTQCVSATPCVFYEFRDAPFDIQWAGESLPEVSLSEIDAEPVALDPQLRSKVAGRYVTEGDTIEVISVGDRLRLRTLFWRTYDLVPLSDGLFAMAVYGLDGLEAIAGPRARVRFVEDEGEVRSLELVLMPSGAVNFAAERIRESS